MKIEIKKLPKSKIEMRIEVSIQEWHKYLNLAAKQLAQDLTVPGFRKGQAPRHIIERELGGGRVLSEAAQLCCRKSYAAALFEKKIEAIGPPKITVLKMAEANPFCFKAETAVLSKILLPDFKKIAKNIKKNKVAVKTKEINETVNYLRKSRAKFVTIARPAQKGDCVKIDLSFIGTGRRPVPTRGGQMFQELKDQVLVIGENSLRPDLEEKLVNMAEGEEKEFELDIHQSQPLSLLKDKGDEQSFVSSTGKIRAKIKMKLVQKVVLPEANDEFARSIGKFKDLADLQKSLQQGILMEKQIKEKDRWRLAAINKITEQTKIELPEILITQEQDKMIQEFKASLKDLGLRFEDYLKRIGGTEKQLTQGFLKNAYQRAKVGLCLREIARQEKIEVSAQEIEEKINKTLSRFSDVAKARKNIDFEAFRVYTEGILENEKVFQFLENIAEK